MERKKTWLSARSKPFAAYTKYVEIRLFGTGTFNKL